MISRRESHFEGRHKPSNRLETDVYFVDDQPNLEIPMYMVRRENEKKRTLHRNNILPVGSIPINLDDQEVVDTPILP